MAERYWFKRRRYGYGWQPATREGWLAVAGVMLVAVGGGIALSVTQPEGAGPVVAYLAAVGAALAVLVVLSIRKGPAPRWRWGASPDDDPDEDL